MGTTTKATKDIDAAIAAMTPSALECRAYGHAFRPYDAWRVARGAVEQRLRCNGCGSIRRLLLSRHGDVMASGYTYPDGYLVKGLGRLTGTDRGRVRMTALTGHTVRDAADG